jgi:hypothetical protein
MKWFRSNIRHGALLALLSLAIQFGLAFGHFHGMAAQAAPVMQSDASHLTGSVEARRSAPQPGSDRSSDRQHPDDGCAICAVIAMAHAVLFASPPLLRLPQAVEFLYRTTDAEFVHLKSARVAFQPRAPPAS